MIYLFLDKNQIKLLSLKKSIVNQYECDSFEKKYQNDLLIKGKITNIDLVASAIKEAISSVSKKNIDKEVVLILPQESFSFFRCQIPADLAPSAITSFIKDKARVELTTNIDTNLYDYFVEQGLFEKQINFFSIEEATAVQFAETLKLIDLKLTMILPEALAYFKLFEKTLRKEKKEKIFYAIYDKDLIRGYLYDSSGLIDKNRWESSLKESEPIEPILKQKTSELEKAGHKLNRLIISGEKSNNIRQDTFTKEVGAWTNPLKKIIPNFYEDYLKMFFNHDKKPFPFLNFDVCFGAFVFTKENNRFLVVKRKGGPNLSLPKIGLPKKEVFIFLASFILSFVLFIFLSKLNLNLSFLKRITPTNTNKVTPTAALPTTIPTPSFTRESLKIKVLNGSGTVGKASEVKDILKEFGYGEILTGNADSFDFSITEIRVKKDKAEAATMIKNDLKDYTTSFKQSLLDDTEAADLVLTIGKDFK